MRTLSQVAAIALVLFVIPGVAITTQAVAPSEYQSVAQAEFKPVTLADSPMTARPTPRPTPRSLPEAIVESHVVLPSRAPRVAINQPDAKPKVVSKVVDSLGTNLPPMGGKHWVQGKSTWYCNANANRGPLSRCVSGYPDTGGFDAYAAAGPRLRIALGGAAAATAPQPWRGKIVTVCGSKTCRRVKLIDWCACHYRSSDERLIDLYKDVFDAVGGGSGTKVSW